MNIQPLADRVLVQPAPAEEKTVGGGRTDLIFPFLSFFRGLRAGRHYAASESV